MEFFHNPNFDFLGKKWYFVALTSLLVVVSLVSLATRGLQYGIDFRGGADVVVRFAEEPSLDAIRTALGAQGFDGAQIQKLRLAESSEAKDVLVRVPPRESEGNETEQDISGQVLRALRSGLDAGSSAAGKLDLNIAGATEIKRELLAAFPGQDSMASSSAEALSAAKNAHGGLFRSLEDARQTPGLSPDVSAWLSEHAATGRFAIRSVDYVGPSVGKELKKQATWAVIFSLVAMLFYIWFRFQKLSYGVSAILTLAHDAIVALGAVSITGKEFDLTVLAAVLTIVGYSINDTIVIFDRVRENIRFRRGDNLEKLFNDSINQTLSRTILTVLLVLMVVIILWLFGGSRLNPFSFTLLVGIISGCYSTIYVSSPIVIWWRTLIDKKTTA